MLLFGGYSGYNGTQYSSNVWELSLSGSPTWSLLAISGPGPGGRFAHSAIYDPVRDQMVVYGGYSPSGLSGDVWALSLSGTPSWTQILPLGPPPDPRGQHTAIYDPVRDRMIVFGGNASSIANDVWSLSLSGSPAWTQLSPSGAPPARFDHTAIYDPVRDQMVVFGGVTYTPTFGYFNDVWTLSLSGLAWTQLAPSGTPPTARFASEAIYDPAADRMIVQGGYGNSGLSAQVFSLDLSTPSWTQLSPTGTSPPRYYHSSIYDPVGQQMIIMGGHDGRYMKDSYALSLSGSPAWTELPTILPAGVGERGERPIMIDDPVRDRLVVFGGYDATYSFPTSLWALPLSGPPVWTELSPAGTPPSGRLDAAAIYDPLRDRLVMFGGVGASYLNDVWELSLSGTPTWTELMPSGFPPGPRYLHTAIYDPVRDQMIVFGGYNNDNVPMNDVWALSLSGTLAWTELIPTGTPPSPRAYHTAIYDPVRDRMLVCGGYDGISVQPAEVWELSLSGAPAWTPLTPTGSPGSRLHHSAIYDPLGDRMVILGGYSSLGTTSDAWELSLAGTPTWSKLEPFGDLPEGRTSHAAAYDPARGRMLVFGGINTSAIPQEDTWALEFATGFTLNVTVDGGGYVTKNPDQSVYLPGTPIELTAVAYPGWRFDGWSGDFSGSSNPLSFVIGADKNVTATFSAIPPLELSETHVDVQCFGAATGSIDLSVTGGTPPYGYSWSNGATTEDLSGLGAGYYSVDVTDSLFNVASLSVTIVEPPALVLGETHADVSTCGASDGSIDLTVTGGTPPYAYAWTNGATTEDLSGLAEGVDSVTVTDSLGCSAGLKVTISGPTPALSATHVDAACSDDSTGSIDLTVTGGIPPYVFAWSNGAVTEDLSGLPPGVYSVVVTDSSGCAVSRSDTIGAPRYTVTANAGPNGSIAPPGASLVECGTDATFTITPDPDYTVDELLVDGSPITPTLTPTLVHVTANHTISVTFKLGVLGVGTHATEFALGFITPNPVREVMQTRFALPVAGAVRLSVLDLQGRELAVLAQGTYSAGWHAATWNGRTNRGAVGAGVYFLRYQVGGRNIVRRFALAR